MEVNVTIPEKTRNQKVLHFIVKPNTKVVQVMIASDEGVQDFSVDITALWTAATTTQKNAIKAFFKRVGALALDAKNQTDGVDVVEADVTGNIFED